MSIYLVSLKYPDKSGHTTHMVEADSPEETKRKLESATGRQSTGIITKVA